MKKGLALEETRVERINLGVAGKARWDRGTLPHAWARADGWTREALMRGRYARLRLEAQVEGEWPANWAVLEVKEGRLTARASERFTGLRLMKQDGRTSLASEVAIYQPERTSLAGAKGTPGELWAEVAVPKRGRPRPVRLGMRLADGRFAPLEGH